MGVHTYTQRQASFRPMHTHTPGRRSVLLELQLLQKQGEHACFPCVVGSILCSFLHVSGGCLSPLGVMPQSWVEPLRAFRTTCTRCLLETPAGSTAHKYFRDVGICLDILDN